MVVDNFWGPELNDFVSFETELKITGGIYSRSDQVILRRKFYTGFLREEQDSDLEEES